MSSSLDAVRCTLHHGAMWMHLDPVSVKIPSQLLEKSPILMNALSVAHPSVARKVTVAAPREWLQSWAVCYCNEEESLTDVDIKDLVKCLLVCLWSWSVAPTVMTIATAVAVFTTYRVPGSTALLCRLPSSLFYINGFRTSECSSVEVYSSQD
jgi:hypothetical protein